MAISDLQITWKIFSEEMPTTVRFMDLTETFYRYGLFRQRGIPLDLSSIKFQVVSPSKGRCSAISEFEEVTGWIVAQDHDPFPIPGENGLFRLSFQHWTPDGVVETDNFKDIARSIGREAFLKRVENHDFKPIDFAFLRF